MIDDRENNEYTDGREDAPPGETGKTEETFLTNEEAGGSFDAHIRLQFLPDADVGIS